MRSDRTLSLVLEGSGTLVVKVGSSLLIEKQGELRNQWMSTLAERLSHRKGPVVLVSSGAIALGRSALGLDARPRLLAQAQAAAAVGQIHLAEAWARCWQAHGRTGAQILLTLSDLEERRRYLNARATLETLIERGIVPVVNENDTVATEEIRFGDNDRLAARVAQLLGADALLLLSDVDGLYSADPERDPQARHLARVDAIDEHIESMAGGCSSSDFGTGGMASKLAAARIATAAGVAVWLASGTSEDPLGDLLQGARNTFFPPAAKRLVQRKQWLASLQQPAGILHVDRGAASALGSGASLLAVGVSAVEGQFERGDLVRLKGPDGFRAQGITAYGAGDLSRILGCRSEELAERLGYAPRGPVVHRDDLVLI